MKITVMVVIMLAALSTSCQKISVKNELVVYNSGDIVINKDTTISGVWKIPPNTILYFTGRGFLRGNGTIDGGVIHAALRQHILDTSLTLVNTTTHGRDFSVMWWGARPESTDNYTALQKSINLVVSSNLLRNCYIPSGIFKYSKSLTINSIYKGSYVGSSIRLYGESDTWYDRSVLQYTGTQGFAIGIQVGKGIEIDHFKVEGNYTPLSATDSVYYRSDYVKYGIRSGYNGIVIDYDGSKSSSGSTNIILHDMNVGGFDVAYSISPNGVTANADVLVFERIRIGDCRIGVEGGQAQEKGNVIRGIYSWGRVHTLISIGNAGKKQAGNYTIDGGNIAGKCIRLFDIKQSGWYGSAISNLYAESIGQIGTITTGDSQTVPPITFTSCTFHFVVPNFTLFYGNNQDRIRFKTCLLRYYGSRIPLILSGWATFEQCSFSGAVTNVNNGIKIIP